MFKFYNNLNCIKKNLILNTFKLPLILTLENFFALKLNKKKFIILLKGLVFNGVYKIKAISLINFIYDPLFLND